MISQKVKIHFSFPCGGSVQGDLRNLGISCRSVSDNFHKNVNFMHH